MRYILTILMLLISLLLFADEQFAAADQSLMVLPTAYTMPKGSHAITNFELVIIQYSYALTDRAHLTSAMVFPFTTDMLKTFSVGGKYNFYRSEKLQSALWTSYTPEPSIATIGNVFSFGNPKTSGHVATALIGSIKEREARGLLGVGILHSLSPRISAIGEAYYVPGKMFTIDIDDDDNDNDFTDGSDDDFDDIKAVLVGIRFRGNQISWDLGAFRPMDDMGDIIALPFLKATFMF